MSHILKEDAKRSGSTAFQDESLISSKKGLQYPIKSQNIMRASHKKAAHSDLPFTPNIFPFYLAFFTST